MKIKNMIASLTVLSVLMAGTAFAMPNNSAKSTQTYETLSIEQKTEWQKLHDKLVQETRSYRSDLRAKYMELRALNHNVKVTPGYLSDLTEDIVELENRIEDMNKDFIRVSKKKFDLDFSEMGYDMGNGHGMKNMPSCMRGNGMNRMHGNYHGNSHGNYHGNSHGCMRGMNNGDMKDMKKNSKNSQQSM